jgi:MFS family permease
VSPGTNASGMHGVPVWLADLRAPAARGLLAWQALTSAVGIFVGTTLMALYLVGPVGLSNGLAAAVLAGSATLTMLGTPLAGRLIRTLGPRRFAIGSCMSRAVLFVLLPLSIATAWTVTCVLLIGLCEAAAFSVYQIIIADALGEGARTEALAVRRTLGNLGFTGGGLIVGVVVTAASREAYAVAFFVCGLSLTVASLLLLRLPRIAPQAAEETVPGERTKARALRDPRFVGMIAVAAVMASSTPLLTVGMPLWIIHETTAPAGMVGVLLIVNTVLVVLLQVRLSRSSSTWRGARIAVVRGGLAFAVAAVLIGLSGLVPAVAAVFMLMVAVVVAAIAEMLDSAGWWTISYDYARPAMRSVYLAAFDIVTPAVSIAGPPLMIGIVALGPSGWFGYGIVFAAVSGIAAVLISARGPAQTG